MKPHPRIRKAIKWGGAVVTVLLVVVWMWSLWNGAMAGRASLFVGVHLGAGWFGYNNGNGMWPFDRATWMDSILPRYSSSVTHWECSVPMYAIVIASLLITRYFWRLDTLVRRSARLNLCPKCNYDRTGLAIDAVCPECGSAPVR